MYTEINQAVNFAASRMHFRLPRLKVCLFSEHLANLLLLRYYEKWSEKYNGQRVLNFASNCGLSDEIGNAAICIGLTVEEVVGCLDGTKIVLNPGEVYYVNGAEALTPKIIWAGSALTADEKFEQGQHVLLSLVPPRELGIENPFPSSDFVMFRYIVPGSQSFTVETFAQTRFGALRKRPDPEVQRRLQKSIIAATHGNSGGGGSRLSGGSPAGGVSYDGNAAVGASRLSAGAAAAFISGA